MKAPVAEGGSLSVFQGTALTLAAVLGVGVVSLPALADRSRRTRVDARLGGADRDLGAAGSNLRRARRAAPGRRRRGDVRPARVRRPGRRRWSGWAFFLAIPIGAPVAAGFGASYVADAAGGGRTTEVGVTAAIIVVVAVMNWLGIQVSAGVQLGIAAVIATLLLVAILVSLPRVDTDNLTPFLTHGWSGVGTAAAVLVWAFAGWEIVSSLSAEYRHPRRDIGRATAMTLVVVTVLYLGIAFVTVAVLGSAAGRAPLADLLAGAFGDWARPLTTVIAVLLTVGAINSYFAGASRLGASLAITGAMPRWLGADIGDGRAYAAARAAVVAGLGLVVTVGEAVLDQPTDATLLVTTGTFALVYVVGTAAAVRLLPGGWPRAAAVVSFIASVGLVVLTGAAGAAPDRDRAGRAVLDVSALGSTRRQRPS